MKKGLATIYMSWPDFFIRSISDIRITFMHRTVEVGREPEPVFEVCDISTLSTKERRRAIRQGRRGIRRVIRHRQRQGLPLGNLKTALQ